MYVWIQINKVLSSPANLVKIQHYSIFLSILYVFFYVCKLWFNDSIYFVCNKTINLVILSKSLFSSARCFFTSTVKLFVYSLISQFKKILWMKYSLMNYFYFKVCQISVSLVWFRFRFSYSFWLELCTFLLGDFISFFIVYF